MKTKLILSVLFIVLFEFDQLPAQSPISITTPRGSEFTAYETPEIWSYQDKLNWGAAYAAAYPYATEQGTATTTSTYNCHSYAWNLSEGGPQAWIGLAGYDPDPNVVEDVYWTDYSYIETTEAYASKISYYADNHSAIQTSTQGEYISKWGDKVLMSHARDYGPASYQLGYRKYYRLQAGILGSTETLCDDQQRTFTSYTTIPGSTYSWTRDDYRLDYVSGAGTDSYRVEATNTSGDAWLNLQMTTPSGEVATSNNKHVWVGQAQIDYIDGPTSVQPYDYNYYYAIANNTDGVTYSWEVDPTGPYLSQSPGSYSALVQFYSNGSYVLYATATNSCGSTSPGWTYVDVGGYFSIYPNPASDNVTITVNEIQPLITTKDSGINYLEKTKDYVNSPHTYTIRIFNRQGTLLSTAIRDGQSFSIPTNNLSDGIYVIEVGNGKNKYTKQLIIKNN
jgi:hypothetical protein